MRLKKIPVRTTFFLVESNRLIAFVVLFIFFSQLAVAEEKLTLAMEDADIHDLIRWASEHIDKNIIIHPDVKGKVTVLAGDPMTQAY